MTPPRDAVRVGSERGSIAYWQLSPLIYASSVQGHMSTDMSRLIIERGGVLFENPGIVSGFHNWLYMTGYDTACRVDLTAWVMRHKARAVLHIGVTSTLVAMGVTVANLALGNLIQVHRSSAELDAALARAL